MMQVPYFSASAREKEAENSWRKLLGPVSFVTSGNFRLLFSSEKLPSSNKKLKSPIFRMSSCVAFAYMDGIVFIDSHLKFTFTCIDEADEGKTFSFSLKVEGSPGLYKGLYICFLRLEEGCLFTY